jgi:hypothetical protein
MPPAGLPPGGLGVQTAWKPTQGLGIVVPAAPGGAADIMAHRLATPARINAPDSRFAMERLRTPSRELAQFPKVVFDFIVPRQD